MVDSKENYKLDLGVKGLSVVWDLTGKSGKNQVSAEETAYFLSHF